MRIPSGLAAVLAAGSLSLGLGYGAAVVMLESGRREPWFRWTAVALGVASLVPGLVAIAWMIRRADEYQRRNALRGIVLGFGLAIVWLAGMHFLALARFIEWRDAGQLWPWLIPIGGAGVAISGLWEKWRG
jgi:hypothetical protein